MLGICDRTMEKKLVNQNYIKTYIMASDPYAKGHAANNNFLGVGMLYYALAYTYRSHLSVCLGSGHGFVPKLMRQAQRDLGIEDESQTILIDADTKHKADYYHNKNSCLLLEYDVKIINNYTNKSLAAITEPIDYLHIDADHEYESVKEDFELYSEKMASNSVISMHDIYFPGVSKLLKEMRGIHHVITVPFGSGTAIVTKSISDRDIKERLFL
jgi:hypothetical protein